MAWFEARRLRKVFTLGGKSVAAIDDLSLFAERGDFVAIVGPSGSGKTTLLRVVAGLLKSDGGELSLGGRPLAESPEKIGVVFQEPRLMPWLTVEKNVLFAYLNAPPRERPVGYARELIGMLGLSHAAHAYPSQLSGGMAQRAALGRALCCRPELILMDEPLSALDYFTRRALRDEILRLHLSEGKTTLFVTHDVEEALTLANRVVALDAGRIRREITVGLAYPRKRTDLRFIEYMEEILSLLAVGQGA